VLLVTCTEFEVVKMEVPPPNPILTEKVERLARYQDIRAVFVEESCRGTVPEAGHVKSPAVLSLAALT
jgi:hypothetical protein